MEVFPIPNQNAETVATKLVHEFIERYGTPLEIHTDQETNFDSQLFKEVCYLLLIKKTRSTPYRPSSNGLIERFNQTLGKMIKSFIENNVNEWDKYLCIFMAAYRSTPHPGTGYSPNMLMLGREVNTPIHILYPLPVEHDQYTTNQYVQNMREKMEQLYHLARENLQRDKRETMILVPVKTLCPLVVLCIN